MPNVGRNELVDLHSKVETFQPLVENKSLLSQAFEELDNLLLDLEFKMGTSGSEVHITSDDLSVIYRQLRKLGRAIGTEPAFKEVMTVIDRLMAENEAELEEIKRQEEGIEKPNDVEGGLPPGAPSPPESGDFPPSPAEPENPLSPEVESKWPRNLFEQVLEEQGFEIHDLFNEVRTHEKANGLTQDERDEWGKLVKIIQDGGVLDDDQKAKNDYYEGKRSDLLKRWGDYYDKLTRMFFSYLLKTSRTAFDLDKLEMPDPINSDTDVIDMGHQKSKYTAKELLVQMERAGMDKSSPEEKKKAEEYRDICGRQLLYFHFIVNKNTNYYLGTSAHGALSMSFESLAQAFPESGTANPDANGYAAGLLDPAVWQTIFLDIGKLYVQDSRTQRWEEDEERFGSMIHEGLRGNLARLYNISKTDLDIINSEYLYDPLKTEEENNGLREALESRKDKIIDDAMRGIYYVQGTHRVDPSDPSSEMEKPEDIDPSPENLFSAMLPDKKGHYHQFAVRAKEIVRKGQVVPYMESKSDAEKERRRANLAELAVSLVPPSRRGRWVRLRNPNEDYKSYKNEMLSESNRGLYRNDLYAAAASIMISNVTFLTSWADSQADVDKTKPDKKKRGEPEAVTLTSRLINYQRVVRKYTKEIMGRATGGEDAATQFVADMNPGLVMESAFTPFFLRYGYDGHPLVWHILRNKKPQGIKWDRVPAGADHDYCAQMNHHLAVVKAIMTEKINFSGLARFNIETGQLEQIDDAKIGKMIGHIRKLVDYTAIGHHSPAEINSVPEKNEDGSDNKEYQENPTGDFIAIEIYDERQNDPSLEKPLKRMVTNIGTLYPLQPQHFVRWVPTSMLKSVEIVDHRQGVDKALVDKGKKVKQTIRIKVRLPDKGEWSTETKHAKDGDADRRETRVNLDKLQFMDAVDPAKLLERELVYRYIMAMIYIGSTQSTITEKDLGALMIAVGSLGKEYIETGWMKGPLYNFWDKALNRADRISGDRLRQIFGTLGIQEIGNFQRRATFYMDDAHSGDQGDNQMYQLIKLLNPNIMLLNESIRRSSGTIMDLMGIRRKKGK